MSERGEQERTGEQVWWKEAEMWERRRGGMAAAVGYARQRVPFFRENATASPVRVAHAR